MCTDFGGIRASIQRFNDCGMISLKWISCLSSVTVLILVLAAVFFILSTSYFFISFPIFIVSRFRPSFPTYSILSCGIGHLVVSRHLPPTFGTRLLNYCQIAAVWNDVPQWYRTLVIKGTVFE
ncbi:hypothetical protein BDQ17DRAFT_1328135 [Cyathus striatus]|nr:hypothetical protein BDQ17DRAFT_1328135 [Cyathus striatus]